MLAMADINPQTAGPKKTLHHYFPVAGRSTNSVGESGTCNKLKQIYSASKKVKIAQYARHHGARAAGRYFGIHHKKCQRWVKEELEKMKNPRKHCRKFKKGQGRKFSYSHELEEQLVKWILEKREESNSSFHRNDPTQRVSP